MRSVSPIAMACLGLVVDRLVKTPSASRMARAALAIIAMAGIVYVARPWIEANRAFIVGAVAGYEWRRDVELQLRAQGVTSPLEVYGDAGFHFVTPDGPGWYSYMPHFNGGWPRLDLYALDRVLPEFATTSLDAFVADGQRRGVTHVVLSGTAGYLLPALGEIYEGRRIDPRLELTATVGGMKIFRLRS